MNTVPIERKSTVSQEAFAREHLHGGGRPVIITDAMDEWRARRMWTFEYLKSAYGSDFATATPGLASHAEKLTRLSTYLDYLDAPGSELPGFWVGARDGKPLRSPPHVSGAPYYLMGWHAFTLHPELYLDVAPAPYFVDDLILALTPQLRDLFQVTCGRDYWSPYIGPADCLSPLHQDFWDTHSLLAQIQGHKRVLLFSPEDSPYLYGGEVDPERPDLTRYPEFDRATIYSGVIGPGEVLFTPSNWWHHVRGLDNTITVSHNFFNAVNFARHMEGILRNLPTLVRALENSPAWREALNITWTAECFEGERFKK